MAARMRDSYVRSVDDSSLHSVCHGRVASTERIVTPLPQGDSVTTELVSKPAFFAISTNTARILTLQAIIVSEWYKPIILLVIFVWS